MMFGILSALIHTLQILVGRPAQNVDKKILSRFTSNLLRLNCEIYLETSNDD